VELAQSGNYSVVTLPAQPGDYAVTVFPAQNAFCTPPVVHQRHDLALARPPLQGSFERLFVASPTVFTRRARQHRKGMIFGPRFARVGFSSIHQTDGAQLKWAQKGHAELDPAKQRR